MGSEKQLAWFTICLDMLMFMCAKVCFKRGGEGFDGSRCCTGEKWIGSIVGLGKFPERDGMRTCLLEQCDTAIQNNPYARATCEPKYKKQLSLLDACDTVYPCANAFLEWLQIYKLSLGRVLNGTGVCGSGLASCSLRVVVRLLLASNMYLLHAETSYVGWTGGVGYSGWGLERAGGPWQLHRGYWAMWGRQDAFSVRYAVVHGLNMHVVCWLVENNDVAHGRLLGFQCRLWYLSESPKLSWGIIPIVHETLWLTEK